MHVELEISPLMSSHKCGQSSACSLAHLGSWENSPPQTALNALQVSASVHQLTRDRPHPTQGCCSPHGCFLPLQRHPAAWRCAVTGLHCRGGFWVTLALTSPACMVTVTSDSWECSKHSLGKLSCAGIACTSKCQECCGNALGHGSHRRCPALVPSLHSHIADESLIHPNFL